MPDHAPIPGTDTQGLVVQVGDVIVRGTGDHATIVLIAWTNRSYIPGARDALNTSQEAPSSRATPVDAIVLVPPVGDGQFSGTALRPESMTYLGWTTPTDDEIETADDDYSAREGHSWRVNDPGYRHLDSSWWQLLRDAAQPQHFPTDH